MAYDYKKKKFYLIQSVAGAALFVLGVLLAVFGESPTAGFAMMLGATFCTTGLLSLGLAHFVQTPGEQAQEARREHIESDDERNRAIREKSGWATQRVMLVVLCAFVVLATFILPFNPAMVVAGWALLVANAFLPYFFAYLYAKRC